MKCEICKRGIKDGVSLHRQNEKGVTGVWRCDDCNTKPVDPEIELIVRAIQQNDTTGNRNRN